MASLATSSDFAEAILASLIYNSTLEDNDMTTPPYFTPERKSESDRPRPSPAAPSKKEVYDDPDFFKSVDEHVSSVAIEDFKTFRDLTWNLIFSKNFDELQTARAVFRWVTLKQFHNYAFDGGMANSPDAILQGFKQGTTSHAEALECLALHAGLHCVVLRGWAKVGENYKLGDPLTDQPANHSWNAIYIDGSWRLMDSRLSEGADSEYDDWFFMPDANQLIYSHFPEDPVWQLSSQVFSKAEFDQYPSIHPQFFDVGMMFLHQNQGINFTHGGIMTLTLGLPEPAALKFELKYGHDEVEHFQGRPLNEYVMQEFMENRVTYYFRAPCNGDFYLTVYAQTVPELFLGSKYKEAITFMIKCENAVSEAKSFSQYTSNACDPRVALEQYGVTSSENRALVQVHNGNYEVTLNKSRPVRFSVHLQNDALSVSQLAQAVVLENRENCAVIKCILPQHGEYGLEIVVHDSEGTGTYSLQYLLWYMTQDFQTLYGLVYGGISLDEPICYNYQPDVYATLAADSQTPLHEVSEEPSGPELAALMKIGTRVQRGVDWRWGDQDGPAPGLGRVIRELDDTDWVRVQWDIGENYNYRMGSMGKYDLKLAERPLMSERSDAEDSEDATGSITQVRPWHERFLSDLELIEAASSDSASKSQPVLAPDPTTSDSSNDTLSLTRRQCPVCMENYNQIQEDNRKLVSTLCGHIFCEACIIGSIESQGSCPTCRNDLSTGDFHPIFL